MRIRRIGRQFHQDLEIRPSFKKDEMLVSTQKKKPARFLLLRSELCPVYLCGLVCSAQTVLVLAIGEGY